MAKNVDRWEKHRWVMSPSYPRENARLIDDMRHKTQGGDTIYVSLYKDVMPGTRVGDCEVVENEQRYSTFSLVCTNSGQK